MLYQRLTLLALTLASVSAFPTQVAKRDVQVNQNGNIKLTFSDEKVNLGTVTIDQIVDGLAAACSTQGQCDTNTLEFKGQSIAAGNGGTVNDEVVKVEPSGDYPTWIHNGLIDVLRAAVKAVAECKDVTHVDDCSSVTAMAYCPENTFTVNECTVPLYWGVNYQAPDSPNSAPPFIGSDLSVEIDTGAGLCDTFTTVGGAVAGAVSGVAGGIFSLLSLACK